MSAVQLVDKKDSIEKEIKEFNGVLETVRDGALAVAQLTRIMCLFCSKVEWGCMDLWWIEMAFPGVTLMCMLCAQLETELHVSTSELDAMQDC